MNKRQRRKHWRRHGKNISYIEYHLIRFRKTYSPPKYTYKNIPFESLYE